MASVMKLYYIDVFYKTPYGNPGQAIKSVMAKNGDAAMNKVRKMYRTRLKKGYKIYGMSAMKGE